MFAMFSKNRPGAQLKNKQSKRKPAGRKQVVQPAGPWVRRVTHGPFVWLSGLLLIIAYMALVGVGNTVARPLLPINSIQVMGDLQGLRIGDLKDAVDSYADAGFFGVDVKAVKQVAEELPWAKTVSVRRVWPDKLEISVTEENAVARWGDEAVINDQGKIFSPQAHNIPSYLVQLNGPEGTHETLLSHYREMQNILSRQALIIARLSYDGRRSIEVELHDGLKLYIGKVKDAQEGAVLMQRFADAYQYALKARADDILGVDLRYTNGLSVRWKSKAKEGVIGSLKMEAVASNNKIMLGNEAEDVING